MSVNEKQAVLGVTGLWFFVAVKAGTLLLQYSFAFILGSSCKSTLSVEIFLFFPMKRKEKIIHSS